MGEPSDEELVRRCRDGDEGAYFALYERHKGKLFLFARRMLGDEGRAADVLQETFEYFFRKVPEFRFEAKVTTLLFRVARHRCLNILDRERRRAALSIDDAGEPENGRGEDPADAAARAELLARVTAAVDGLPPIYREVVVLKLLRGMTYEEIGAVVGCPAGTVKSRLHNGMVRLRRVVGPAVNAPPPRRSDADGGRDGVRGPGR